MRARAGKKPRAKPRRKRAVEIEDVGDVSDVDLDRELSRRGLRYFVEMAFPMIAPSETFVPGWHIDAICAHLEAVADGRIRRLVINVPPGSMKSLLCCVFFPAWLWTTRPGYRGLFGSYSAPNSSRDSLKTRRLIESAWYRQRWGATVKPRRDLWGAAKFENTSGGFRLATSPGGGATGEHVHLEVIDDPIKPIDAQTGLRMVTNAALDEAKDWISQTLSSRFVDKAKGALVIVMQRLHPNDPSGNALAEGGFEHLCLPMRFDPARRCRTSIGFEDPRTTKGELLWSRFTEDGVKAEAKSLGERGTAAQHDQRPAPAGGYIFKREWIKFWTVAPVGGTRLQSWDFAFTDTAKADPISGQLWCAKEGEFYLLDRVGDTMTFNGSLQVMRTFSGKHSTVTKKLVENKANGHAIENTLQKEIGGIELVNPQGGKVVRALAVEPLFASGNVWLPHPKNAPWVHDFVEQLVNFPSVPHDDDVDALTQALIFLYASNVGRWSDAMKHVAAHGIR